MISKRANAISGLDKKRGFSTGLKPKTAQVTIFIIIALLILAGIGIYFLTKGTFTIGLSKDMQPVESYYVDCLKETTRQGVALLGEQSGHIKMPGFDPGSYYMPFSSQLNFFGQAVPYWMYVSGNNIVKEQVPTKQDMESDLANYIKERYDLCDFSSFVSRGYDVSLKPGDVSVQILDTQVTVSVKSALAVDTENNSVIVNTHDFSVNSKLGKFYNLALEVYNKEKADAFLESYAVDTLRLYAPVTGVEFTCTPKIFLKENIKKDLINALQANVAAIRLNGNYYTLANPENKYFVVDSGTKVDEGVNFIYSPNFPTKIEITGDEVINPVGLQQGMGILGFCYVPYHFVYDMDFPVLVQFYDSDSTEVFQFPVAVVIKNNQPRNSLATGVGVSLDDTLCQYKSQKVIVKTSDYEGNPIKSTIKFKCASTVCEIGQTKEYSNGEFLEGMFPQCVNGFVIASADGYADAKYQVSTNEAGFVDVALQKVYSIPLEINTGSDSFAMLSFEGVDYSTNVMYPNLANVSLKEGSYNVTAYVFKNSTLKIPSATDNKCFKVPKSGLLGQLGIKEEKCFDVEIPGQDVGFVVVGGGKTSDYFTEDNLKNARVLTVTADSFSLPSTLQGIQENYVKVDDAKLELSLT